MKLTEVGNGSMDLVEAQEAMAEEGKNHISVELLKNYALNKTSLTILDVQKIEVHINGEKCKRCVNQIKLMQNILKL